jgi:hypothetical protein
VRPTANDSGLVVNVLTSGDLANWSTPDELGLNYLPVSETTEILDDDYSTVTQVYEIRIDEDQRFYRVAVAQFDGL